MRVRGLEAFQKWICADERVLREVGESIVIQGCVEKLGLPTVEHGRRDGTEEEEGVSVEEKSALLGIVLEVVEGGMWKGGYEELEEVVGRLEEEGEKGWRERKKGRRGERGRNGGMEWRKMGRLAREVGWGIEKRKRREEGRGGEGEIISLCGIKKHLEEEKKKVEEKDKQLEEEKKRGDEEGRLKEEEKRKRIESENKAE